MQKGFINENTEHLVPKIVKFVKEKDFSLIIGTRYINTCYTACHIYDCWEGSESAELVPEIASLCDVVIDKHGFSCWGSYEPSVCAAFSRLKIDSIESTSDGIVYVCGMNGYRFKESELMSVDEYKSSL